MLVHDELGLVADYGLRYIDPDPVAHVAFPDGEHFTMWLDPERTVAEIARFSAADAVAYRRMLDEYDQVKSIFTESQFTPIGFGPALDQRLAEHPAGRIWQRRRALSAWDVIRHEFTSRHVRAFMLWMAFQTNQAVDVPGSGLLAYSLIYGRQQRSWSILSGGSGRLTDALVGYLEQHGGTVLCDKAVTGLLLDQDRCVGVRTADGEEYRAGTAVMLDHPHQAPARHGAARVVASGVPLRGGYLRRGHPRLWQLPGHDRGAGLRHRRRPGDRRVGRYRGLARGRGQARHRPAGGPVRHRGALAAGGHAHAGSTRGGPPRGSTPSRC